MAQCPEKILVFILFSLWDEFLELKISLVKIIILSQYGVYDGYKAFLGSFTGVELEV